MTNKIHPSTPRQACFFNNFMILLCHWKYVNSNNVLTGGDNFILQIRDYRADWHLEVNQPVAGNYYPVCLYCKQNSMIVYFLAIFKAISFMLKILLRKFKFLVNAWVLWPFKRWQLSVKKVIYISYCQNVWILNLRSSKRSVLTRFMW